MVIEKHGRILTICNITQPFNIRSYLALKIGFCYGSCAITAPIFVISRPFLAPVIAAHATFSLIFLILNTDATTKDLIVTVVDWSSKAKPPHGVSGWWIHQTAVAVNLRKGQTN